MLVLSLYALAVVFTAWISYALTDPNLLLVNSVGFESWQSWMWQTFFVQPHRMAWVYGVTITLLWTLFGLVVWQRKRWLSFFQGFEGWIIALCVLGMLTLSYNWLSHDVFNYIFNAKMFLVYGVDPHERVALDFVYDPWTRFMHNTHTPAPYGHGWTYLSTLPFLLGFEKFALTWWLFRIFSVLGLAVTGLAVWWWGKEEKVAGISLKVGLIALSPFVLIEFVQNSHNDGWMMVGAVCAVWWARRFSRGKQWWWLVAGSLVWAASIYIKLASMALAPVLVALVIARWHARVRDWLTLERVALTASILMFLPLLTSQSKWFLPWYLIWAVTWLPLLRNSIWWSVLAGFAISGSYRYLPWLWSGNYDSGEASAVAITWLGGVGFSVLLLSIRRHMYNERT